MKKISITSILVFILLTINVVLVYFLLFNTSLLNRWLNQFDGETVITTSTSEPIEEVADYYELTNSTMAEVVTPYKLIVTEGDAFYDVNNYGTFQTVMELLAKQSIEVVSNSVETEPSRYQEIISGDYLQLIYPTKFSVLSLKSIISLPADVSTQFELNRLVIPRGKGDEVYLVDTSNNSFLTAKFKKTETATEVFQRIDAVRNEQWLPVSAHALGYDTVYLPIYETIASSQIYSLDKLPDSLFLDDVFPNNQYDISEPDANAVRSYHTLLTSFQINDATNVMNINHSISASQGNNSINREFILPEEKVRYSLPYIQTYEYWPSDLRLYSESSNTLTYRRFLNGLPIYSAPNLADYGATRVTLRTNPNIEVYRYQMPLVTIGTHIHDLSRAYDIESGQQIEKLLTEQGLSFTNFTNIILGYEWQTEMENFKTVTLVPKWFFHINNTYYPIDQIRDGTVSEILGQTVNSMNNIDEGADYTALPLQDTPNKIALFHAGLNQELLATQQTEARLFQYTPRSTKWNSLIQVPSKQLNLVWSSKQGGHIDGF